MDIELPTVGTGPHPPTQGEEGVTGATVEVPQGAGQFRDLGQVQYPEAQAGATVRTGATTTGPKTSSTIPMAVATP